MTLEEMKKYSDIYKKHQKKLSKIIMVIVIILGISFIIGGVLIPIFNYNNDNLFLGIIMVMAGFLDILLIIKFDKSNQKNITNMSDEEASTRYCKIYGINK